jgi:hypothetical protein
MSDNSNNSKVSAEVDVSVNQITEIQLLISNVGDIASGLIRLVYSGEVLNTQGEIMFELDYGNVVGPDGLTKVVKDKPGDKVRCDIGIPSLHSKGQIAVPEKVVNDAKKVLAKHHYETRTGNDGSVFLYKGKGAIEQIE